MLISSLHVDSAEIVRHESGHAFGGLADEYGDPFPGYTPTEKPNATAQTNRALIKWNAWIAPTTPLPTPQDPTNAQLVGLFEGAEYQVTGWYRPKFDCKMRTLGTPFCEVCSEALVRAIYTAIRPIDSFSPSLTNLTCQNSLPGKDSNGNFAGAAVMRRSVCRIKNRPLRRPAIQYDLRGMCPTKGEKMASLA